MNKTMTNLLRFLIVGFLSCDVALAGNLGSSEKMKRQTAEVSSKEN
jgi:hypothetical protein